RGAGFRCPMAAGAAPFTEPGWLVGAAPLPNRGLLLLVFRRHSRREERSKRHLVAGARSRQQTPARRGIATRGVQDHAGRDVLPGGLEHAAPAIAKIGSATALRAAGCNLARSLVGFLRKRVAIGNAKRPGDTARPIAVVERLDPEIDRARIALQRVRLHDPGLQQLETCGESVDAGPPQQPAYPDKACDIERARHYHDD